MLMQQSRLWIHYAWYSCAAIDTFESPSLESIQSECTHRKRSLFTQVEFASPRECHRPPAKGAPEIAVGLGKGGHTLHNAARI